MHRMPGDPTTELRIPACLACALPQPHALAVLMAGWVGAAAAQQCPSSGSGGLVVANGGCSATISGGTYQTPDRAAFRAGSRGSITVTGPVTITTGRPGVSTDSPGAYALNGGHIEFQASGSTISTNASSALAHALAAQGAGSSITAVGTTLNTRGSDIRAAFAISNATMNLTDTVHITSGAGGYGIVAATGAFVTATGSHITTTGGVSPNGAPSIGILAQEGGQVQLHGGTATEVRTSGTQAYGLVSMSSGRSNMRLVADGSSGPLKVVTGLKVQW
jgi:hypothetical protein